jgi:glucose repression regulatory protein TUP1
MGEHQIDSMIWSPDDQSIAFLIDLSTISVWEVHTGLEVVTTTGSNQLYDIAWSPDGQFIAAGGIEGVLVFSASDGTQVAALSLPDSVEFSYPSVFSVAWSGDGTVLAVGELGGIITLWNTANWSIKQQFTLSAEDSGRDIPNVVSLAWSPDQRFIASEGLLASGLAAHMDVWDVATGTSVYSDIMRGNLVWSEAGQYLAYVGVDGIMFLDSTSWQPVHHIATENNGHLTVSPDGKLLAYYNIEAEIIMMFNRNSRHLDQTIEVIPGRPQSRPFPEWSNLSGDLAITDGFGGVAIYHQGRQ